MTMTNYQIYFTDINGIETRTQTTFCSEALVHSFIESAIACAKQIIFHGKPTEAFKSSEYVSLREICGKRSISWRIFEVISGQNYFGKKSRVSQKGDIYEKVIFRYGWHVSRLADGHL